MLKEKLTSRKFWLAIITALLTTLQSELGLKIPIEAIYAVLAWILVEGAADTVRAAKS